MNIKDYLHLYLGCYWSNGKHSVLMTNHNMYDGAYSDYKIKLRPLSDMTEDERNEIEILRGDESGVISIPSPIWGSIKKYMPFVFSYLLSKHFDLFGLIDAGLAIDKTQQNA